MIIIILCVVALGAGYVFMKRFLSGSAGSVTRSKQQPVGKAVETPKVVTVVAPVAVEEGNTARKAPTRRHVPQKTAIPSSSSSASSSRSATPHNVVVEATGRSSPVLMVEDSNTPGSGGRVRGLSVKRSKMSPLTNLEKLRSNSQSRLPREVPKEQHTRPQVQLTEPELAGIAELKRRLEKDGIQRCVIPGHFASDDSFIGRFVRGKRCDLDAAYTQLTASLKWRAEQRIDTITVWYRKEFAASAEGLDAYYPWQNHGVDLHGVNVVWDRLPSMDFRLLMNSFSKEELIYWHLEQLEQNMQRLFEHGRFGGVFIEDFTGLSMAHWYAPAVDFLKMMMAVDQQNYPELSAAIFYTNAPRVLSVLWPMLKPFMDPLTVAKVHIASDGGAEQLREFMGNDSIPVEYGGACISCAGKHSDGRCLDYARGGHFLSTKKVRYTTASVPARGHFEAAVTVEKLPTTLAWKFMCSPSTDTVDMELVEAGQSDKAVLSIGKSSASEGVFEFQHSGKYIVRFGNVASYWSAKTVGYCLQLRDPFNLAEKDQSFDSSA